MIERRPFTKALAAALAVGTGMPVGIGRMPEAKAPYYVLYSLDGTVSGAPLADENEDASFVYQVTCVSGPDPARPGSTGSVDQAEWLVDKAKKAILGRDVMTGQWTSPITVPGVSIMCRSVDVEPGGTNDPTDGIINYVIRFKFDLTPA
ncbi:hypothetical protein E6R18_25045 [Streptomyces sp. A1277]|uniref:hypothetical protein n=1 Tax=Streptomyces sp. A1277 TaxID=2563103 RepID=UPI0010A29BE2|nr:hypothetical protein [Streptomyces sp. A1277]THA29181.1 hypothetical protein E6R18_25045 [Streptomyces sp. A1277]